jgi:putative oxidoreductase
MGYRYESDVSCWPPDWVEGDERRQRRERSSSKAETIPLLLGRAIFGGYFLYNGINHFLHKDMMAGYAKSKGVPSAELAVPGTGLLLIAGGLSLITGYKPKLGVALIATFLAGVSPSIHKFWSESDPQQRQTEMIQFMKNMGLLGGALIAASKQEPWPYSPSARTVA